MKRVSSHFSCVFGVLLLCASPALSQSVLDFPRVISNSNIFTGMVVSNPTPANASVTFTAFQGDGTSVTGTGITNPITIAVPAGGQVALQFGDIFGGTSDFNGWVQATSATTGLTGYFLNGNPAETDLDGAATIQPSASFVLPFANENATAVTEVTLVNVNAESAQATLTLFDPTGASLATTSDTLPGLGVLRQTLTTLFGAGDYSNASHVAVQSNRLLIGHEVVANYIVAGNPLAHESIALSAQPPTTAAKYIIPEFAVGGGYASLLGLVNSGGVAQQVTLTAYNNDGTLANVPNNPKRIALSANAGLRDTLENLFGFTDEKLSTGWIQVTSSLGYLSCYLAYGGSAAPAFTAVSGVDIATASKTGIYSEVSQSAGFFAGLSLVNPGATTANVQLYTIRPDGTTVGKATFTVGPNQAESGLISQILPASLNQSGGWGLIRSDQPLIGAVLFGAGNGASLANVPQQGQTADYVPPNQTTASITGSVLAGGQAVNNVSVALTGPVTASGSTDGNGNYIFPQLPNGAYSVTATFPGAQFDPSQQSVVIAGQNVAGVNFQAGGIESAALPVIDFVTPASTYSGQSAFSLTVVGQNFTPTSVVSLNGIPLSTSFINTTELQAAVPSSNLVQAQALSVVVQTPPPGGGSSTALSFNVIQPPSNPLIAGRSSKGQTGSFPAGVAIDTSRNHALVANESSDSVSVIDLKTFSAVPQIPVHRSPAEGIAYAPNQDLALVANFGSANVDVIDLKTNTVKQTIPVGTDPMGIAVDSTLNQAYVTNNGSNDVWVIDLTSLSVIAKIPVDKGPDGIAINELKHLAVVANRTSGTASLIDLNTNTVTSVVVGQGPRGVAIDSDTNLAIVVNANSNDISVIDLNFAYVQQTIAVGTGPTQVGIHKLTNMALVTNSGVAHVTDTVQTNANVSIIDMTSRTVVESVAVGSEAYGISIDQGNQVAVVTDFNSDDVIVVNVPNPTPVIGGVQPTTFPVGVASVTLTITGTGFLPTSVVTLNGQTLPTTYVSTTQLTAVLSGALLTQLTQVHGSVVTTKKGNVAADPAQQQFNLGVNNPCPCAGGSDGSSGGSGSGSGGSGSGSGGSGSGSGGSGSGSGGSGSGSGGSVTTKLQPTNGVPVLSGMSPTSFAIPPGGAGDFSLTLTGNNFSSLSAVSVGGLPTSLVSSSSTTITVSVSVSGPGSFPVSVTNPAPGGGTSGSLTLTVTPPANPAPAVSSVSPSSINAGSPATTVTVTGSGFSSTPGATTTATLGTAIGTLNGSTITFNVPANQSVGQLSGLISNPAPGGGTASFVVNILNPVPSVSGFSPNKAATGSPDMAIQVTGSNFVSNSTITFGNTAVPTTFGTSGTLNGTIPASFLQGANSFPIGVSNPAPGGGSASAPGSFTVTSALPVLRSVSPAQIPASTVAAP